MTFKCWLFYIASLLHLHLYQCKKLTIYVPVPYMAQDVRILMRANPLQGQLEGMGSENREIFGP